MEHLKQKTCSDLTINPDGSHRRAKLLKADEIEFIKNHRKVLGWNAVMKEINFSRPVGFQISLTGVMKQCSDLGLCRSAKTKQNKDSNDSELFDPHEFDHFYNY